MFSHIQVGARDLQAMIDFYSPVLQALGLERMPDDDDGGPAGAGWRMPGRDWPQFYVQLPFDGRPASAGNGVQVSFSAASPDAVRQAWANAIAQGATDEGAPGLRVHYADDFYAAYCRDPEGNKLCFVSAAGLG